MKSKQNKNRQPKLNLPRPYMSWSGLNLWERSPKQFIKHYFYGEAGFENAAMRFGREMAERLDSKEDHDDEVLNMVATILPGNGHTEYPLEVPFLDYGIDLFGKFDNWHPKTRILRERKTGKIPWNQMKANTHGQLAFYAFMLWLEKKKLPKEIWLDWIETEEAERGVITLTGAIKSFRVNISMIDIFKMGARIKRAAKEISKAYNEEIKQAFK